MNVLANWFSMLGLEIRKAGTPPTSTQRKTPTQVEMSLRNAAALKRARRGAKLAQQVKRAKAASRNG